MNRHDLFEELEAFDPVWFDTYRYIGEAVEAAAAETPYIRDIWRDWLSTPDGCKYQANIADVPDVKGYIEECQKAEEDSPFFQQATRSFNGPALRDSGRYHFDEER